MIFIEIIIPDFLQIGVPIIGIFLVTRITKAIDKNTRALEKIQDDIHKILFK